VCVCVCVCKVEFVPYFHCAPHRVGI